MNIYHTSPFDEKSDAMLRLAGIVDEPLAAMLLKIKSDLESINAIGKGND